MPSPSRSLHPLAAAAALALLSAGDARAAAMNAPISGEIQRIALNDPADVWSGGTIVVGGQTVIVPRNLLVDLPANRLTLQELFALAPPACLATGESGLAKADACNTTGMGGIAAIAANRTSAGNIIAGDLFIQKGAETVSGAITYVDHASGFFRVNGIPGDPASGAMVRLNDPSARHTVQRGPGCAGGSEAVNCSPDPRFSLDPDNYTNVFTTGYPLCIPSTVARTFTDVLGLGATTAQAAGDGSGDVLCPMTNRTVNGGQPVADSRRFAPLRVGDWVTAEGNFETVGGVYFLSAHTSTIGKALTTADDPTQPDYMFLDEVEVDTAGFQNQRARTLIIGYTTRAATDVLVWKIHNDPATNTPHEFPFASTAGCDAADGVGSCTAQGLAPGLGGVAGAVTNIFRIRYDVDFVLGAAGAPAKPKLSPCSHLRHEPRFQRVNGAEFCPSARADGTSTLAEEFAILSPLPRELQARTGHKLANPNLRTIDVSGNEATNGQYLFPFGVGLGGVSFPEMNEINLDAFQTPFGFTGLPWTLDRRLSPGGCSNAGCESTPQPLDPYPFEGIDPRLQAATPRGPWLDPNFTASRLSITANRVLSFVDVVKANFDGDATLLAWPPVDPPALPIAPAVPVSLVCAAGGTAGNQPPFAGTDSASTVAGVPITIAVLANDSDPDGGTVALTGVTQGANGAVAVAGSAVTFTPAAGFVGTDAFTYTIADGQGGTAIGQVTVQVAARPNQAPTAVADSATTPAGTPVQIAVLANDTDPDADALTVTAVGVPANGTAATNGSSVTYTPAAGFSGTDAFSYTISDGRGGTASANVSVTVSPERLVVTLAQFRLSTGEWRVSGTSDAIGATVTVHVGQTLAGPVLGTAQVIPGGTWSVRVIAPPPDASRTVSVESTGGGVRQAVRVTIR